MQTLISCMRWLIFLSLILCGCQLESKTLFSAAAKADSISAVVVRSAESIRQAAENVSSLAKQGQQEAPQLAGIWQGLITQAEALKRAALELSGLQGQISGIKADIKKAEQEQAALAKRLEKAEGETARRLRLLMTLSVVLIGATVGIGVWLGQAKLAVAGAAAGAAMLVTSILVGAIIKVALWFAIGLVTLCVVWTVAEWIIRGSLRKALTTSPVQDIKDLL